MWNQWLAHMRTNKNSQNSIATKNIVKIIMPVTLLNKLWKIFSLLDEINVRTIDGMIITYSILDFCFVEVENQGSNSFF